MLIIGDCLGWKNPFSNQLFTERQRQYKKAQKLKHVATPGFIVSG